MRLRSACKRAIASRLRSRRDGLLSAREERASQTTVGRRPLGRSAEARQLAGVDAVHRHDLCKGRGSRRNGIEDSPLAHRVKEAAGFLSRRLFVDRGVVARADLQAGVPRCGRRGGGSPDTFVLACARTGRPGEPRADRPPASFGLWWSAAGGAGPAPMGSAWRLSTSRRLATRLSSSASARPPGCRRSREIASAHTGPPRYLAGNRAPAPGGDSSARSWAYRPSRRGARGRGSNRRARAARRTAATTAQRRPSPVGSAAAERRLGAGSGHDPARARRLQHRRASRPVARSGTPDRPCPPRSPAARARSPSAPP